MKLLDNQRWYHLGAVSWGEFCYEDRYTPGKNTLFCLVNMLILCSYWSGVYANTINMRQWLVETLDNNM